MTFPVIRDRNLLQARPFYLMPIEAYNIVEHQHQNKGSEGAKPDKPRYRGKISHGTTNLEVSNPQGHRLTKDIENGRMKEIPLEYPYIENAEQRNRRTRNRN